MLLETLCNTDGVSGDEGDVRALILEEIRPYADEITVDSMGNILALKKGTKGGKKVMVSAHMDEVGFIISGYTEQGYLKFKTVGGIDTRVIISKKVRVGKRLPGVIGMKAIHLQKPGERDSVPEISSLFIDIGAKSKEEAKQAVKLGTYAAFDTRYQELGADKVAGKALDDRVGCLALTELIKKQYEADVYACFLVQEEVGLRGAQIAANRIGPDAALVLEGTTCSDVFGSKEHEYVTRCGAGAAVSFMDSSIVVNPQIRERFCALAKEAGIPFQYKNTTMGGNDAGAIHISGSGVKTMALSVPCRYLHSPVSIASKKDIQSLEQLADLFLTQIGGIMQWNY